MMRDVFTKLWNDILSQAVEAKASDIHLGPSSEAPNDYQLNFRIAGHLSLQNTYQNALGLLLLDHLKRQSCLDVAERRIPQDGRLSSQAADFRVSTLPCLGGEKAVLRILRRNARPRLKQVGLPEQALNEVKQALSQKSGLIVIAGATGSGKTTTIHALLGEIDSTKLNVATLEDPVEYRAPQLSQVQITKSLTFASGLRSLLRQDPDVIFVGECRDSETARLAIEAAGTGHLVLTTVHTGSVDQIRDRFVELGCDKDSVGKNLIFAGFQRLIPENGKLRLDFEWRTTL